jgi:undecaprenyl-diphosphatase
LILSLILSFVDQSLSQECRAFWQGLQPETLKLAMKVVQLLGKADVLTLITLACGACGLRRPAVAMVLALVLSAVMVWPIKVAVHRERPNASSHYSFPSGDAAAAAAAAWPLMARFPRGVPFIAAGVGAVAAGRVLTGAHYPSDVAAGAALGALAGGLSVAFLRRVRLRLTWRHFAGSAAVLVLSALCLGAIGKRGDLERMATAMAIYGPPAALAVACRVLRAVRRARGSPGCRR